MKVYETMRRSENLGWCSPYFANVDGKEYWMVVCDGSVISLQTPNGDVGSPTENDMMNFVKSVKWYEEDCIFDRNPRRIALMNMEEKGCADCPWRDLCDAMYMDNEEGDNNESGNHVEQNR